MSHAVVRWLDRCEGAAPSAVELAACKTLASGVPVSLRTRRNEQSRGTRHRREDKKTSTDYTYQIPSEFNPSRDGTLCIDGLKNANSLSRSYDAASNS